MLQIYNSFTQKKEPFVPQLAGKISLYVCGITIYDYCHIGHARVFVAFDVVVRFLRASGWQVHYVRNITDIDDKIITRAQENQESITDLTERFIRAMHEDASALNVLSPDLEPKATQHIATIIEMIEKLMQKDFAYLAENGDVYFQVEKYPSYGQLAHKDLDSLQSGARVEVSTQKRSDVDFVLWKKAKPQEPQWPSPWGAGRPGWHIECSAMSTHCLGDTFDLHGGGADLAFPHHENERAQSECATGKPFVNTWMHVGFVQVDKEKMSKSLHNFFTIREVLSVYDAEVLRYFLSASHYRSPVNYAKELLDNAKQALTRLYMALRGVDLTQNTPVTDTEGYKARFFEAMNDDFNTPIAISVLFELVTAIHTAKDKQDKAYINLARLLKELGDILGIFTRSPEDFLQGETEDKVEIEALIKAREAARLAKDWAKADALRKELSAKRVELEDKPGGTIWRRI